MLKTISLQNIYELLGDNVFDFDYDFDDVVINDVTYNKNLLEETFKEYWWLYQIGYSTVDEFKWRLKRCWKKTISVFRQKLLLYPTEQNLNEETSTFNYSTDSDNKYSDTPNQPMLDVDPVGKYLTNRTYINVNGNNENIKTKNALSKFSDVQRYIEDVLYSFISSFNYLFITDVIIYDGIFNKGEL